MMPRLLSTDLTQQELSELMSEVHDLLRKAKEDRNFFMRQPLERRKWDGLWGAEARIEEWEEFAGLIRMLHYRMHHAH